MTLSELKALTAQWLDDKNYGYFSEAVITIWLNNALNELQKKLLLVGQAYYEKPVQTPCVARQADYVLPSDFRKLHRLEVVTGGSGIDETVTPIVPVTTNQKDIIMYNGAGTPQYYHLKRNRLTLYPAPDRAYTLRLYHSYQVAPMVNASDVPDAPDEYHEYIALLAAQDGFMKDGRSSELLVKKIGEYEKAIAKDALERNEDMPRGIVQTGSMDQSAFMW